jgi:hypothetical protein
MTIHLGALARTLATLTVGLLLAGCTLFDVGGAAVRLEPPGPIRTNGPLAVRIAVAAGSGKARLLLDGRELGTFEVGQDHVIDLTREPDGSHRLVARAYDGDRSRDSGPLEVVIDRVAPQARFQPAPGQVVTEGPLVIQVDFNKQVAASVTAPGGVVLRSQAQGAVAVTASLDPSGNRLVVTSAARFLDIEPATLEIAARDMAGNRLVTSSRFSAPHLLVDHAFEAPSGGLAGIVSIAVRSWQPALATSLAVDVDGVPLGTVQPGDRLSWDTRASPGPAHRLAFRSPGHAPHVVDVITDNDDTPPALLQCAPHGAAAGDASLVRGVDVVLSEQVCHQAYVSGGSCLTFGLPSGPQGAWSSALVIVPPQGMPPSSWLVDLSPYRDRSGLPVAGSCTVDFPVWRAPWGAGPLPVEGDLVVVGRLSRDRTLDEAELVRIDPAGAVERVASTAPGVPRPVGAALNGSPGSAASGLQAGQYGAAWMEAGSSDVLIRSFSPARGLPVSLVTSRVVDDPVLARPGGEVVGWIETLAGRRVLRVTAAGLSQALPHVFDQPGSEPSEATVISSAQAMRAAFLATEAGGVPQVRLRELATGAPAWTDRGGVLNLDPLRAASEPALGADLLNDPDRMLIVWVEGGQVLARRVDNTGVGAAQVLNADPAARARAPQVLAGRVVFVEQVAGADVFQVRQWDDFAGPGGWVTLPSLPAEGGVMTWTGQPYPLTVLWKDTAGAWRLRAYNE